ncbi:NAD(P)H-dependent flavin oxidoreductase [Brevibacterium aurantiacum]|uniref:Propionate 3-nitronate monooxygenase n=2 Tax=Micrococcales TaxID=85006 RepID=A0A2A3X2N1_BREAU|nr:nitronate monooxygenase [Brevibacterium aurantiacum]MDN5594118.1 nitronate monooxygenase [Brevibacterium sp.]AZL07107.1 2-nitropropane dioxygenase [Brevibacterium aurantiacum]AZL10703.1 2-nitropropane dioxygenase [Brevibacterium aurantiacum]MDN5608274.1 nitronate monooxygenase [Brevibacterium sp.]MDN5660733.1 nitronate monooxygenase [Brevibacterium aurantiacum]
MTTIAFEKTALPIIGAPMAGGTTTPDLTAAVARAGGFPFVAGGYLTAEALAPLIDRMRETTENFGVNLFAPNPVPIDRAAFDAFASALEPVAAERGLTLNPEPVDDDDHYAQKVDYLLAHPVPLVSMTFNIPTAEVVARLHDVGTQVAATVTTPAEARTGAERGVDALIVQGPRAGGHSGTADPTRSIEDRATSDVVRDVLAEVDLPIAAGGGVDGVEMVEALLQAGASTVVVGTLLLRTDEAGTAETHRAALASDDFTETQLTRAFTGRLARALVNDFVRTFDSIAVNAYPAVHHLTKSFRAQAKKDGDPQGLHLWAGTGYRGAREASAQTIVKELGAQFAR